MDRVPQEVIEHITSYLSRHELQNTLTLSRKFQIATERESALWKRCTISASNAETFLEYYNADRLHYLRTIVFKTCFAPLIDTEDRAHKDIFKWKRTICRDSLDDLKAMDEDFTRQISSLFQTLERIQNSMLLNRKHNSRRFKLKIMTPTREVDEWYCAHRKYLSWRIHLLSPDLLPEISIIRAFYIVQDGAGNMSVKEPHGTSVKLDARVLLDMASKLPNLELLKCELWEDEWTSSSPSIAIQHYTRGWEGPHQDSRNDFAKAVQAVVLPASLKRVNLNFSNPYYSMPENVDQRRPLPNLIKPASYDLFSTSLRLLSYQLRRLQLVVVADETLFWPSDGSEPSWPNLEYLNVRFQMATPRGGFNFHGLLGHGKTTEGFDISAASYPPLGPERDNEDRRIDGDESMDWSIGDGFQFRIIPFDRVIVPFLTGFAKAAAKMPSLTDAVLWTPLEYAVGGLEEWYTDQSDYASVERDEYGYLKLSWGIVFLAPNERCFLSLKESGPGEHYSECRQLWWKVGKWRPEPELHDLFQKIGRDGEEKLLEYWEDNSCEEYYCHGLAERGVLARCDNFDEC